MPLKKKQPVTDAPASGLTTKEVDEVFKPNEQLTAVLSNTNHYVYCEKAYTVKVGDDYTKIVTGATMPVNPTPEELANTKKAMVVVSEMVEEQLLDEIKRLNILKEPPTKPERRKRNG